MRIKMLLSIVAAGTALTACGSSSHVTASTRPIETTAPTAVTTTTAITATAATSTTVAHVGTTSLGAVVVDAEGRTLYGLTKDAGGASTCTGGCATAWPPVIVAADINVDGLDRSLFSVIDRPDGTKQLKMGKWPLYRFAGDSAAGDINGQGSGGTWFAVGADGKLVK